MIRCFNSIPLRPSPVEEKEQEAETIEDESELILDRVEEEMAAAYSEESDEENIFHVNDLILNKNKKIKTEENTRLKEVVSNVDEEAWHLELERVLPQLKVTIKSDNRDWRSHIDQMKTHKKNIEEVLRNTKGQLDKLYYDISSSLEKISNREKHLNNDLENVLDEYRYFFFLAFPFLTGSYLLLPNFSRSLQEELSKFQDNYKSISGGVTDRTRELSKLSDQLDSVKQQMEERGNSMTDGSKFIPLPESSIFEIVTLRFSTTG